MHSVHISSYLLITLDSCRYDTFVAAQVPNLKAVGKLWKARAPSHYTFTSHMAIFTGFTPGVAESLEPYANPRRIKIFRINHSGTTLSQHILVEGVDIIDGFNRINYVTVGTGAASWFNPATNGSRHLIGTFQHFYYAGNCWSLRKATEMD